MKRVLILVEGQTEEDFVNDVLNEHLRTKGVNLTPTLVTTKRVSGKSHFKGGVSSYGKVKFNILQLLKDTDATMVTTMIDYCRLSGKGFPGSENPSHRRPTRISLMERVRALEVAWKNDIDNNRFSPYFAVHEFESLLFASPHHIVKNFPEIPATATQDFEAIRAKFPSPEYINNLNPPSQRIQKILNQYGVRYEKPLHGVYIANDIGLDTMRRECPRFSNWLSLLESLGTEQ